MASVIIFLKFTKSDAQGTVPIKCITLDLKTAVWVCMCVIKSGIVCFGQISAARAEQKLAARAPSRKLQKLPIQLS